MVHGAWCIVARVAWWHQQDSAHQHMHTRMRTGDLTVLPLRNDSAPRSSIRLLRKALSLTWIVWVGVVGVLHQRGCRGRLQTVGLRPRPGPRRRQQQITDCRSAHTDCSKVRKNVQDCHIHPPPTHTHTHLVPGVTAEEGKLGKPPSILCRYTGVGGWGGSLLPSPTFKEHTRPSAVFMHVSSIVFLSPDLKPRSNVNLIE